MQKFDSFCFEKERIFLEFPNGISKDIASFYLFIFFLISMRLQTSVIINLRFKSTAIIIKEGINKIFFHCNGVRADTVS